MITVDEAMDILKSESDPIQILNYSEYEGKYVFQTAPEDTVVIPFMPIIGGYFSVDMETKKVDPFNPKFESDFWKSETHDLSGLEEFYKDLDV